MNQQIRIRNHTLLVALAAAYPMTGHAASVARLEFVSGNVVAITAAGVQRELSRGSELQPGDTIRTSDNARAQLRFSDGGMMSLQPRTDFRIDEYRYDGKLDGQERSFFSLIRGGLRTISGLIGHGNRDNYKVSTSVATIGIRGTEYSAVFTGGQDGILNLATGEGAVEICNAGGCAIVASGQSAVVTGDSAPKFTPVKPNLPATPISSVAAPVYSSIEDRSASGTSTLFGSDLVSGSGYAIVSVYKDGSSLSYNYTDSASASFEPGSKLVNYNDGFYTYTAGTVKSAFSVDGIIGWGVWSSGSYDGGYAGTTPLSDLHYVVGKATSATDLNNLSGMTGTYQLIGYTNPTSTAGYVGSNVTGSLTAAFNGSGTSVSADIGFQMNGVNVTASVSNMSMSGSSTFGGCSSTSNIGGTVEVKGLFAGANASHAGLIYAIDGTNAGLGQIGGAQAYKQTSLSVTPVPH